MAIDGGQDTAGAVRLNLNAQNNRIVQFKEPILVPPFNPYAKVTSGLPGYMPWKHMSPVIPNIDRLELDMQFTADTLPASLFHYRYAREAGNGNLEEVRLNTAAAAFEAHLLLYWYEVPNRITIPRSVTLQTWNMREFIDPVNSGAAVASGAIVSVAGSLLQLRSVPTLIVMHARRNNDDNVNYRARSITADDDFQGTNQTLTAGINSLDAFMEIVDLTVTLGDRPNVISPRFTARELYQLTLKNSKYLGFSLSYEDWVGRVVQTHTQNVVDGTVILQQSKAFIALQPKDIAEKVSSGVFFPTSLQFIITFRARNGAFHVPSGAPQVYRMFTHVYIGKHWLTVEPDRAQYQEQNIPLESALRASVPSLVSSGGAGGGDAYTSKF